MSYMVIVLGGETSPPVCGCLDLKVSLSLSTDLPEFIYTGTIAHYCSRNWDNMCSTGLESTIEKYNWKIAYS